MHRRSCLRAAGAALPLALAGCSEDDGGDGGDGDGGSGDDPSSVTVEALDASSADLDDPVTSLTIEYDSRAQVLVDPDEGEDLGSSGRSVNLVLQFRVTNDGEEPVRVDPTMFQVASANDEDVYARNDVDDPDQFPDRRLDPGDVANGWVVFTLPGSEARVLLVVRQDQLSSPATTTFEGTDLDFTIDDDETGTTAPTGTAGLAAVEDPG